MQRGLVHKLNGKRERAVLDSKLVRFDDWKKGHKYKKYSMACQPSVSPPDPGFYSERWEKVTCPACLAQRPKLTLC